MFSAGNLFLLATITCALLAWYQSNQDGKQKDRIEDLGKENSKLTQQVEKLSAINNDIASNNSSLTQHNIELTNKTRQLIEEVQKLTTASNAIINKVDARAERQATETASRGEFDLAFEKPLEDNETIAVYLGNIRTGNWVHRYKSDTPPGSVSLDGETDLAQLRVINGEMKFSAKIYNLQGKWIADIENNAWNRNPNNTGMFNYDSKGFEIIDNKGFVAFSVELISRTEVRIQGYLFDRNVGGMMVIGTSGMKPLRANSTYKEMTDTIRSVKTEKIFDYTSKNWLGKRR